MKLINYKGIKSVKVKRKLLKFYKPCPECGGSGYSWPDGGQCDRCGGLGEI